MPIAPNRYVINLYSQSDEFRSSDDDSPLRLFLIQGLVHGLITTLLAVMAVEIGLLW